MSRLEVIQIKLYSNIRFLIRLLTNDDLPVFPIVGHLVGHSVLGKRGSAHDEDQDSGHILLVGGLILVLTVPSTVAATEKRPKQN